uniref:Secreted protein n=1 Tax=Strongyloides papillosus TaxID=174720 RepID=A0A0N5C019_STREA
MAHSIRMKVILQIACVFINKYISYWSGIYAYKLLIMRQILVSILFAMRNKEENLHITSPPTGL